MQKPVAIIAHSFRFPGTSQQSFWSDLLANKNLISSVEPSRWAQDTFLHPDRRHPGTSYTFSAGSIGDISGFDAAFFGISPREAGLMDPQQRLLLELAWETFENAGIAPNAVRGSDCGVYIGLSSVDYAYRLADDLSAIASPSATGIVSSIAANRLSYFFDFHGPSMTLDTACSSSLVAVHQACQAIRIGEISTALAGGINLHLHPFGFISFSKASMLSKTGQCHVFSASGDGYVRSEGGGLVLLKDYQQALADGDLILAVIAGSGVNTDGSKSGLTIPNAKAQAKLISDVYLKAGIHPDHIDYFEAHGTGTPVGDPIETQAIGLALGQKRKSPLLIGSVKSNLGHLESASGIAGLIKALYCLKHRVVPATLGLEKLNPNINFNEWHLNAVTKNQPLSAEGQLTIGINSFGFGGANAHLVIQSPVTTPTEAHQITVQTQPSSVLPLILSGKDAQALQESAQAMVNFMLANHSLSFYDLCYTAFFHRERHCKVALLFAENLEAGLTTLQVFSGETSAETLQSTFKQPNVYIGDTLSTANGPAWVFAGNGCQWQGMGKSLLEQSALFRETILEIDDHFISYADYSLFDDLSGKLGIDRYHKTEFAQPALFALQVGLCRVLQALGVQPVAVIGHSVGEVAGAWAVGALSLADAVKVIYYRSFYQSQTEGMGQMTAVGLGAEMMQKRLDDLSLKQIYIAGINSPRGVTVAGDSLELTQLETHLKKDQVFYKRLDLNYPFHTPFMDRIETGIQSSLAGIQPMKGQIAFYSTVTGNLLSGEELDGDYWWHNIRQPVKFEQSISAILNTGVNTFVEIGAHPVLKSYLQDSLKVHSMEGRVIPTFKKNHGDMNALHSSTAQTLMSGCLNPKNSKQKTNHWFSYKGNFIQLPNYAWQREKLWHPITSESYGFLSRHKVHPLLGYPLKQLARQWENQLDTQLYPYLNDHNVGGAVLFPGAGFAEVALAMAWQSQPRDYLEIEELEIRSPLVLSYEHSKVFRSTLDNDGRFTLLSREHANINETEWTQHCTGRVINGSSGYSLAFTELAIPSRPFDFERIGHNQLTASVSLNYGSAFQAISFGWIEGDSAIGVLEVPELIGEDLEAYILHPAFLDGAFQLVFQILKKEMINHDDMAFVPVKMGKILVQRAKIVPRFAKAVVLSRSPHSLNTHIALFDADGHCIAQIESVRFRAVRLHRQATQKPYYLDYHLIASPLKSINTGIDFNPALLTDCLKDKALTIKADRYSQELEPLLDSLCHYTLIECLISLVDKTGFLPNSLLNNYVALNPGLSQLLLAELAISTEDKIFTEQTEGWQLNREIAHQQLSAQAIWTALAHDYPEYFYLILLAGRLGLQFPNIIANQSTHQASIFTPDQYTEITNLIFRQTCKTAITALLTTQLEQIVATQTIGERLKVLEISCHQPEFAGFLLPKLNLGECDYVFGCVSQSAVNHAEQLREHYPRFKAINLQENEDNIAVEDQDKANFAIIFLNFGQIADVHKIINLLPRLVAQNSPVMFIGLHPARWIDHVLGVSKEWWIASEEKINFSSQLTSEQLLRQLVTQNFTGNNVHNCGNGDLSGIYLINTRTPTRQKPINTNKQLQNWLILCGSEAPEQSLASQLSTHLIAQGHHVTFSGERWQVTENIDNFQHIVNLSGFAQPDIALQLQRCELAVQIIKATESSPNKPTIWLLTHNVSSLYACHQENAFSTRINQIAHDSAIWGFGRTLMNETPDGCIRLLDISGDSLNIDANTIAVICEEFLANNPEQEVFFTQNSKRFVPRLRSRSDLMPSRLENTLQSHSRLYLGFSSPGQLKNLQWQTTSWQSLSADEIEIDVHATGLNFRDIMYTLGLLPDEAVENGFVGSTLGLEFAGIVKKTGANITGFNIGDHVVGMGPASFSNVVRTKANAIAIIPNELDFSSAATIPSTFFTAYYALHHQANLQAGEKVLIHGAAGGIGIAAIQIARWLGAEIFATVGSDEKRDFLKLLGVKHIYDSRSLRFSDEILAKTNHQGVDVVLNSLAGEAIDRNFKVLKPFGRFLELGKRDFYENTYISLRPFRNNISYFGIDADQLMKERPELTQKLFLEMMTLFSRGVFHPLPYTVFDANHIVEAFRYMQQAKQIGKVVISYEQGINYFSKNKALKKSLTLNPTATYLVTGGLGGFGLKTAQWLVAKGARYLCLVSRSGAVSEEAKIAMNQFAGQGVQVLASACDITDKNALKALLDTCQKNLPVLKGIIHSAAVFEDGLASQTDSGRIKRVLEPKILGALYLHELTQSLAIDFFVLYSSITTLFGNPGQSNYVAANLWLEALASFRHQHKLPVSCICFGAIEDVGFLARHEKIKEALKIRMGGSALDSDTALSALEDVLLTNAPTLGFSHFDWRALSHYLPAGRSPKFIELTLNAPNQHNEDIHRLDIASLVMQLSDDELKDKFIDLLKVELSQILLIAKDRIDANQSIYDMGMDSLMGLELLIAIENRFNVQIPVMALSESATLSKLADRLIINLRDENKQPEIDNTLSINQLANQHGTEISQKELDNIQLSLESNKASHVINQ